MGTITLSDPTTGTSLDLINAQSATNDRQGAVNVSPPPGFGSDTPFLTALEQEGRVTIQGAATGLRLAEDPAFSNTPLEALAQWAAQFEAFTNGAQGVGYDLTRDYRTGDTFRGYIPDLSWTRRAGEKLELGYSLSFVRGQGVGPDDPPTADTVSPGGDYAVDGETLPNITELQIEKSQEVGVARRTFAQSPDDNDLTNDSGAVRTVIVTGQVTGTATERTAFDDALTGSIGQDELVTFEDAFTGRTYDGFIRSYEPTDEAGRTRLNEYGLEFVEGTV
jgi:hypothetical protein